MLTCKNKQEKKGKNNKYKERANRQNKIKPNQTKHKEETNIRTNFYLLFFSFQWKEEEIKTTNSTFL